MKQFKSLAILSLSAIMSLSAYAETHNQKQPVKKSHQNSAKKVEQAPAKKLNNTQHKANHHKKAPITEQELLKRFSDSVELKFKGIQVTQQNNQNIAHFSYELKNKSKYGMSKVHWATVFSVNKKAVLILEEPIKFQGEFKPGAVLPLTYSVPFSKLPQLTQQAFSDPKNEVAYEFQAKSIDFTNGKRIVVK